MRKLIPISSIAILFASSLHAQDNKWKIAFEAGAGIPVGKFGSKNINDSTASFANIGPVVNLSLGYQLTRRIGLSFFLSGQQNNVDTKNIDASLETAFPEEKFSSHSNNWLIGKITAGTYILLPLDKENRFDFTARVTAGVLKTSVYKFSQTRITDTNSSISGAGGTIESFSLAIQPVKWAFTYLAGAGLQYNFDKEIFFKTNIDYSAASLSFIRTGYESTGGPTSSTGIPNQIIRHYPKQPFASLNWSAGIGINL